MNIINDKIVETEEYCYMDEAILEGNDIIILL